MLATCFLFKQAVRRLYHSPFVKEGTPHDLDFLSDTIKISPPRELRDWNVTVDKEEVGVHGCC